ncbi:MAG: hypothetical protein WA862_03405 [Solirubrobacterales bacterium]
MKGIEGSGVGQLGPIQGIALDGNGDIYVGDWTNRRVQKFSPDGEFLLMFGGGVDQGPNHPGNLCTAAFVAAGDTCGAGTGGNPGPGEGQFGTWVLGSFIAVSPDDTVYVGDQERIQEFNPNGTYKGKIESAALAGEKVQSLAVDPIGNVYVSFAGPASHLQLSAPNVQKLSPTGTPICTIEAKNPTAIATDPSGNVYVVDSAAFLEQSRPTAIRQFDSACADKNEPFGVGEIANSTGIATSSACGVQGVSVYVSNSDFFDSFVRAYGQRPDPAICPPPKAAPDIDAQYATSVSVSDAVLRAEINPHFWLDTTYYVEYGSASCAASSCAKQPLPPGAVLKGAGSDEAVRSGAVVLSGLQPGTTYHYRFVARSGGSDHEEVRGLGGKVGADGGESTFTTFPAVPTPKVDCPNQAFRTGASAPLPDCRAYEMVSPVDKNSGDIATFGRAVQPRFPTALEQSSLDGERIAYSSATAFGDAVSSPWTSQYIASRQAGVAWSTHGISPPRAGKSLIGNAAVKFTLEYKAFSPDLCEAWLQHDTEPILAFGAVEGFPNLYRRENCGAVAESYEALSTSFPPIQPPSQYRTELQGVSADGAKSFFVANDQLTADAPNVGFKVQLYVAAGGAVRFVCILPDGSPSPKACTAGTLNANAPAEGRDNTVAGAVSVDGSRVYWTAASDQSGPGALYLRENPDREQSALENGDECSEPEQACTIAVAAANARFWAAASDGSKAIYTVDNELVDNELFEFDAEEGASSLIAEGALGVVGTSRDASRIYFASNRNLSGEEQNSRGQKAQEGQPNLYLYEAGEEGGAGTTTFIATLSGDDVKATSPLSMVNAEPGFRAVRVSADGEHLAFTSSAAPTGYDNSDVASAKADAEVYLYGAAGGQLVCISCNPSGARPAGRELEIDREPRHVWVASSIPGWETQLYAPRVLAEDGSHLFFEAVDALVPRDTNAKQDVYRWERAANAKACEEEGAELYVSSSGGCLSLISSGQSPADSEFADASPDGHDVFFRTLSSLVPQDPGLIDLYDAREGGGLPAPQTRAVCEGEACQGPQAPPNDPTPASVAFEGAGNVKEGGPKPRCAKGKARRKGRCVAKPHKRAHHKRANHKKRANLKRRAGR